MIIMPMAITRCPYCHAIIDEADKYCNNCGTQLLFSEDEEIEEEIPGEKIIDAEVEEKDYTVNEPEDEKRRRPVPAKDLEAEIGEELEEKAPAGTGKTAIEELMAGEGLEEQEPTEEVILVDEIEASEAAAGPKDEDEIEEPAGGDKDLEDEEEAEDLEEDLEDEIEKEPAKPAEAAAASERAKEETREYGTPAAPPSAPEEPEIEYVNQGEEPEVAGTAGGASLKPVTFDSQEIENLGRTVDLGREKIDKFIEVMAAKTSETGPLPVAPQPEDQAEAEPEPGPEPAKAPAPPSTGSLPPWASTMKGAPVFAEDTRPVEPKVLGESETSDTAEMEIFPRRRDSDSTIGLPEKVSQAPLPFTGGEEEEEAEPGEGFEPAEEEAEEGEGAEELNARDLAPTEAVLSAGPVRPVREPILPSRGAEIARPERAEAGEFVEAEEPAPRPPFSFSAFFKSKLFDLLFVGLFWLVALWLAASSMGSTLFDVLGSVSGSMLLLYGVFILLYFFLFKFFLGETIGDRLFRPRE